MDTIADMAIGQDDVQVNPGNDESSDDVFSPNRCRLQRRGAFRNKERSYATALGVNPSPTVVTSTTPLLPELVHSDRVQNVSHALEMIPPLALKPVNPSTTTTEARTSSRMKKLNPKYVGQQWK